MKLIVIITPPKESVKVESALRDSRTTFTKLESKSGILQKKNTTLLLGVEEDKIEVVLDMIKQCCQTVEQVSSVPPSQGTEPGEFVATDKIAKLSIAGAVVFVLPIERFLKF